MIDSKFHADFRKAVTAAKQMNPSQDPAEIVCDFLEKLTEEIASLRACLEQKEITVKIVQEPSAGGCGGVFEVPGARFVSGGGGGGGSTDITYRIPIGCLKPND